MGVVALRHGEQRRAVDAYRASLSLPTTRHRDKRLIVDAVAGIAAVASRVRPVAAARLYGAADALREQVGGRVLLISSVVVDHADVQRKLAQQLGEVRFNELFAEGRALDQTGIDVQISFVDGELARGEQPLPKDGPAGLSKRETEVFHLAGFSLSNDEIAERLNIESSTVAKHVQKILKKLEIPSRSSIAAIAARYRDR
jgi:DNA-binding NarL/FixJ family response regulator